MAKYLGLFLFILSFNISAKENNSASLKLRGFVPVTYKVHVHHHGNRPVVQVHSNRTKEFLYPKSTVKKINNNYLVSIVHP